MDEQTLPCNCGRSTTGYCLGKQIISQPPAGTVGAWIPPCDYDLAQQALEDASSDSTPE